MRKNCKENEIYNPKTKKCVLKTGKIGKELLKQQKEQQEKEVISDTDILNEVCVKWLMEKLKDPLTKEQIMEKSINYKYYNTICKKNENLINKTIISPKMERKEPKVTKEVKVKEPKVTKPKEVKEPKEPKVTKPKEVKEPKEIKINKKACIVKQGKELIIADKIKLVKQFGSKSVFGINFISSFIDNPDFQFSAKIQFSTREGKKELEILKRMNEYRIKNNYINFPVMYDYTVCPVMTNVEDLPDFFKVKTKSKSYITILNELMSGDLYNYILKIANNNNYELLLNAIEQIYMCIASLHSFGINHNDSHSGNFLFKKIDAGGYFHYVINGTDYYIPNIGYVWTIWDFGVSSQIHRHYDYADDYNFLNLSFRHHDDSRITTVFKEKYSLDDGKKYRNWGNVESSVKIPSQIVELVEYLWNYSGNDDMNTGVKLMKDELSEDKWLNNLLKNKKLFNHKPKATEKIVNTTIINFQKVTKDQFNILINKKAFPFDLTFMDK